MLALPACSCTTGSLTALLGCRGAPFPLGMGNTGRMWPLFVGGMGLMSRRGGERTGVTIEVTAGRRTARGVAARESSWMIPTHRATIASVTIIRRDALGGIQLPPLEDYTTPCSGV